jgi:hypothetical protein
MQSLLFCQANVDKSEQKELTLSHTACTKRTLFEENSKMSAQHQRTSAKIFQFPARGRFAPVNGAVQQDNALPTVEIGSGWYHEEAIKEEQKAKARQH